MGLSEIENYLQEIRRDPSFIKSDVLEALAYEGGAETTWVEIDQPEFTSLCPKTGLPDFGTVRIRYRPDRHVVELKSLKYYFLQYRNVGIFYEQLTPLILEHLVQRLKPLEMIVAASFTARGGLHTTVTSSFLKQS